MNSDYQHFNDFKKGTFKSCPFETVYRNVHSGLKKVMAKKRIYQNVISVRLTDTEKSKLETVIQTFKTNKSEFVRDWINRLLETI